jgi:nucleoside triphosphate pyrophosphatase
MDLDLVLASGSPRRADLMKSAGFHFRTVPADIDESLQPEETPREHVRRLSRAKAMEVARQAPKATIIGADTVVVVEGEILGKPRDRDDARRMLGLLAGRRHLVFTGVALWRRGELRDHVEISAVEFGPMTKEEIEWYIASGEPLDKAGAYAIQGLGSRFVTRIEGSYSNVVGLPVAMVYGLLHD